MTDPSLFTLPYDSGLAAGLSALGHQVRLYGCQKRAGDGDESAVPLVPLFYRVANKHWARRLPNAARLGLKGLDHIGSMCALRKRLAAVPPDVIHMQWLPLPLVDGRYLPGLRRLAPLVLTLHDTNPFNGNPSARLQALGGTRILRHFDRLIVHTAQGRARLIARGIPANHITTLPHGPLGTAADARPDPMTGDITFLLFGKLKPYKGADLLIEAFGRLPPALRTRAKLRIVGEPYMDLAPLRALASFHGVTSQLSIEPRFVAETETAVLFGPGTVAMFPYREIEASGVLSLAITHGRAIIASRLGAFGDVLVDGSHGQLVPPEDISALTAAMARMLGDRAWAAKCAAQVCQLQRNLPNWTDIAGQTAALYQEARSRWDG